MPKPSFSSTWTTGARQLVVQLAFEMMLCLAGSYLSSFTPSTMVMSSFLAGAEMMTFLAPAVDVALGLRRVGEQAGRLDDDVHAQRLPRQRGRAVLGGQTLDLLAVDDQHVVLGRVGARLLAESTVPGNLPWIESYLSR